MLRKIFISGATRFRTKTEAATILKMEPDGEKRKEAPSTTKKPRRKRNKRQEDGVEVEQNRNELKFNKHSTNYFRSLKSCVEDDVKNAEFFFEKGLRKVRPHHFTWSSFAKLHWVDRTIEDLFTHEFNSLTVQCLESKLNNKNFKVNTEQVGIDYKIKMGDFLQHTVHRHEAPVKDEKITIVDENADYLVVNKPASWPIHPCGRFHFNSLIAILAKDTNYKHLKVVHRFDRLTSGILILARTSKSASKFHEQMRQKELEKEYVCRVKGDFPYETHESHEPIKCIDLKNGVYQVRAEGKECHTKFERVSHCSDHSILRCFPVTGRTHQIRVHLQHLGYPIQNDPIYARPEFVAAKLLPPSDADELLKKYCFQRTEPYIPKKTTVDTTDPYYDPDCSECNIDFQDPSEGELSIYLHALRYKSDSWEFKTELPDWSNCTETG